MADVAIIQAKKFLPKGIKKCVYIGSKQEDGKIYFNDDVFFRCSHDKKIVELYYQEKQNWVITDILEITGLSNLNATQAQNMIHGSGAVASHDAVENAVQWAIDKVTNNYISYDTTTYSVRDVNSLTYNCSTFVITAFWQAGFPINTARNTSGMVADFTACGFDWIPGTYWPASELQRGDIQLNTQLGTLGHTNIYIGNNQDVDCGGDPGAIFTHTPNNWDRGWEGILRYAG